MHTLVGYLFVEYEQVHGDVKEFEVLKSRKSWVMFEDLM